MVEPARTHIHSGQEAVTSFLQDIIFCLREGGMKLPY